MHFLPIFLSFFFFLYFYPTAHFDCDSTAEPQFATRLSGGRGRGGGGGRTGEAGVGWAARGSGVQTKSVLMDG